MIDIQLFRSGPKQLVGLDISSSAVKLVELSGSSSENCQLERYAIETLPREAVVDGNIANLEMVADAIKRAMRRMGSSAKVAALALPDAAVITKRITLPADLREQEMEFQVETEASQYIPFAIEEVNLDFQVIGPSSSDDGDVEVLIAASRKEKVDDRVAVAEAAGLKAVVVDVESFSAQASYTLVRRQLPDRAHGKVVALVDIGASAMSVSIIKDGKQIYAREQTVGGAKLTQDIARHYGMSFDEAEKAKREGKLPEDCDRTFIRPFLDSVALEISRALQFFFTSTQYNDVDHVVLAGGCAVVPGLADIVAGRTQVPTTVANPFKRMTLEAKVKAKALESDASSLMVACGLALRRFDK